MKKTISFVVALVMLCSVCFAAVPRASEYISSGNAASTATAVKGEIEITYDVTGRGRMTKIGASKIIVQEKNGGSWETVKTFWGSVSNGMLDENTTSHAGSVTYTGTSGKQYRAIVTVYAENSGGSDSRTVTTAAVSAK